jgi:hypothetical protein
LHAPTIQKKLPRQEWQVLRSCRRLKLELFAKKTGRFCSEQAKNASLMFPRCNRQLKLAAVIQSSSSGTAGSTSTARPDDRESSYPISAAARNTWNGVRHMQGPSSAHTGIRCTPVLSFPTERATRVDFRELSSDTPLVEACKIACWSWPARSEYPQQGWPHDVDQEFITATNNYHCILHDLESASRGSSFARVNLASVGSQE